MLQLSTPLTPTLCVTLNEKLCLGEPLSVWNPLVSHAGHSYESASAAAARRGALLVKGVKSMWRQAAPYVQAVLQVRASMFKPCPGGVRGVHIHGMRVLGVLVEEGWRACVHVHYAWCTGGVFAFRWCLLQGCS